MLPDTLQRLKARVLYFATHYTWAFVAIMTITLVSCAFSIHYLATLEADLQDVYENDVRGGDSIQSAYAALLGVESSLKDTLLFPDRRTQVRARAEVRARVGILKASMANAAPRFYTPKAKQALLNSRDDLKVFLGELQGVLDVEEAGKRPDAKSLESLAEASTSLQRDFDLLVANRIANSSKGVGELIFQLRLSLVFTIVLVIVSVLVRVVLYWAGRPGRKV